MNHPATGEPTPATPRKRRGRRIVAWVLASIGALIVVAVVGFLLWANIGVMAAEPDALAAVRADQDVTVTDAGGAWVLAPASGESDTGLVFIPGAKVDPLAYAATLYRRHDNALTARIEAGRPRYGVDMQEDTIPLEAGIESRGISFEKGCYAGQEVVIRILNRGGGRVARRLVWVEHAPRAQDASEWSTYYTRTENGKVVYEDQWNTEYSALIDDKGKKIPTPRVPIAEIDGTYLGPSF